MLKEKNIQFADQNQDFWFTHIFADEDHMLSVFYDRNPRIIRFLYLEGLGGESRKSLNWSEKDGLKYSSLDSGESTALANQSPITLKHQHFDLEPFWNHFSDHSREIDPAINKFIHPRCVSLKT